MKTCISLTLLLLSAPLQYANGFLISSSSPKHKILSFSSNSDRLQMSSDSSNFDVDSARKQLESLMGSDTSSSSSGDNGGNNKEKSEVESQFTLQDLLTSTLVELPPPPPLSTIERDRRLAELQMLQQLVYDDEASNALWDLWYSERGSTAQSLLQEADRLIGDPTSWQDAETILIGLVDKYGIYFVEPLNRLATLYFLQGKLEESYKLCQVILKIKPWHFGALSGIVQVCIGMGDRNAARAWAEKRLPTLVASSGSFPPFAEEGPVNPRREEWVDRAVTNAKELLKSAEKRTKQSFGEPEQYYKNSKQEGGESGSNSNHILDEDNTDGSAWQ